MLSPLVFRRRRLVLEIVAFCGMVVIIIIWFSTLASLFCWLVPGILLLQMRRHYHSITIPPGEIERHYLWHRHQHNLRRFDSRPWSDLMSSIFVHLWYRLQQWAYQITRYRQNISSSTWEFDKHVYFITLVKIWWHKYLKYFWYIFHASCLKKQLYFVRIFFHLKLLFISINIEFIMTYLSYLFSGSNISLWNSLALSMTMPVLASSEWRQTPLKALLFISMVTLLKRYRIGSCLFSQQWARPGDRARRPRRLRAWATATIVNAWKASIAVKVMTDAQHSEHSPKHAGRGPDSSDDRQNAHSPTLSWIPLPMNILMRASSRCGELRYEGLISMTTRAWMTNWNVALRALHCGAWYNGHVCAGLICWLSRLFADECRVI